MNNLRKVVGFLMAVVLVAFTSPVLAQQAKMFALVMSYPSPDNPGYHRALFRNDSPGNSVINSIYLYAPIGPTIGEVKLQSQNINTKKDIVGNKVSLSYIPGIQSKGGSWWVDVKLNPAPACSNWNAEAFAGNAFSQKFDFPSGPVAGCVVKVDISPTSTAQSATGVPVTATFTPNTASFGALKLDVPSGLTIKTVPTINLPIGTTGTITWSETSITVTGLNPAVQASGPLVLRFTVDVAPRCGANSEVTWTPFVYTGLVASGTTFVIDSTSVLKTSITATTCTLSAAPIPTNTSTNSVLPDITLTLIGGSGVSGINVTTSSSCTIGGTTTTTVSEGIGTLSGLKFTTAGSCTLTFTATGTEYGGTSTTFTTSAITVYPYGDLDCGQQVSLAGANPGNYTDTASGWANGFRGATNSKGGCDYKIDYSVVNKLTTTNEFGIVWTGDPNAALSFAANFKKVDVPTSGLGSGWPSALLRLKSGWKFNGATPVYINALACMAPIEPLTYGKLNSAVSTGATSISVNLVGSNTPPAAPFAISIDSERLVVTGVIGISSPYTWDLQAATQASHTVGSLVASKYPGLPEEYGTIDSITPGGTTATCSANCATLAIASRFRDFPPNAPFPIQISTGERMLVTKVNSQTSLEVSRGNGNTPQNAAIGSKIVSSPLPLIPASAIPSGVTIYTAGTVAQMCVSTYGWMSGGVNPETNALQIIPFAEWYDIGDGWMASD